MGKKRGEAYLQTLGKNLKQIREQKGLSLRKLENLSEIDFSQIHRIEKGITNPSITVLVALCDALSIKISELVEVSEK